MLYAVMYISIVLIVLLYLFCMKHNLRMFMRRLCFIRLDSNVVPSQHVSDNVDGSVHAHDRHKVCAHSRAVHSQQNHGEQTVL